jgi:glycerol-3-phosphate O-acyltransferase
MVVDAALGARETTVYYCPISVGYERVVEEKAYARELLGGEKQVEDVRGLGKALETVLGRYGRVTVTFGRTLTLPDIAAELGMDLDDATRTPPKRRKLVSRLAHRVMNEINAATPVTAGALVAMALLSHDARALPYAELLDEVRRLVDTLRGLGARFSTALIPEGSGRIREAALLEACDLFLSAGHVRIADTLSQGRDRARADSVYEVVEESRAMLDIAKNSIVHFFVERAIVATSATGEVHASPDAVRDRAKWLSRLFKYEFQFRADRDFDAIFDEVWQAREPERSAFYVAVLRPFVEAYLIVARTLRSAKGASTSEDIERRALAVGERMYLKREIERREALSRPMFTNALASFADLGYLRRDGKDVVLAETYQSPEMVATIEARIAAYLVRPAASPSSQVDSRY